MPGHSPHPAWWKNSRGEWYVVAQSILFALIAFGPGWGDVHLDVPGPLRIVSLALGAALGLIGLVLALAGVFGLGDNLSVFPHPKDNATLVQSGAYGVVCHPIYAGLIVGAMGWALLNASVLTFGYAVALFVFFDVKSRREERWLMRTFPAYAAYRTRVHKLILFVY